MSFPLCVNNGKTFEEQRTKKPAKDKKNNNCLTNKVTLPSQVLEKCQLREVIQEKKEGLDSLGACLFVCVL